jgi:hypothetical protein
MARCWTVLHLQKAVFGTARNTISLLAYCKLSLQIAHQFKSQTDTLRTLPIFECLWLTMHRVKSDSEHYMQKVAHMSMTIYRSLAVVLE